MTLRTLNYGNYGIFLIMGSAGYCPSTVGSRLGFGSRAQGLGSAVSGSAPSLGLESWVPLKGSIRVTIRDL